ncbi:MAG: RagB/SusD family nutrient uptake outer membrane protein [Adhaeribacter sp.]
MWNYQISKIWRTACLLSGLLLALPACELLDQAPADTLTREEFFETEADALASLIAGYDALQSAVGRMAELGEARGDLVEGVPGNEFRQQLLSPTSGNARWSHFYGIINRVNTTIKYVPEIVKKDLRFTQAESDALLAEAYYLRALAYFYLVRSWGEVPLVLHPSDTDNQDYNIPQASQEEVLKQIEADLALAEKNIPTSFSTPAITRGRATKGAVNALQTDLYLWWGKYQPALQAADKVLANPNYSLVAGANWPNMFFAGNASESIFEVQFNFAQDELNGTIYTYGLTNYAINIDHLQRYTDEQDVVRSAWASYSPTTGELWKFTGADNRGSARRARQDGNWIVYRLADVMLMRAEALNRLDKRDEAVTALEVIRKRANLANMAVTASSTLEEVEDAILNERGLELAFEGKRWFDLLRIARHGRPEVLRTKVLDSYPESARFVYEARLADERGWYLPVANSELQTNKALIQNPFYL